MNPSFYLLAPRSNSKPYFCLEYRPWSRDCGLWDTTINRPHRPLSFRPCVTRPPNHGIPL